jgi:hypothetical protein
MFFFLEIYCAAVKQNTSEQSDIKIELLQFKIKSRAYSWNNFPPGATEPNMLNGCNNSTE